MKLQVSGRLAGTVCAPVSKSDLHRLMIAASLSSGETLIRRCGPSADIDATTRVLQAAGAEIQLQGDTLRIHGVPSLPSPQPDDVPCLCECGESGSTLRFLVPLFAALGRSARFTGSGRLIQRPMEPLIQQLSLHGITFALPDTPSFTLPLCISGRLEAGEFRFPGSVSSQYITGLLFALPLLKGDSFLRVTSPLESRSYVDLTLDVLSRFGIQIQALPDGWAIPGGQTYRSPGELSAQGDWSNAAFWICAGALAATPSHPVAVTGIDFSSLQGDKAVCTILREMGANLEIGSDQVVCKGGKLRGVTIDGAQIPDIIPVLSAVAAFAKGTTQILHAGRLRIKESDRLSVMTANLRAIGADVTELPEGLIINGRPYLFGGEVHACNDHRIAMSMAIASLRCENPVVIEDPMCVAKSYPAFYNDFQKLGGTVHVLNLGQSY